MYFIGVDLGTSGCKFLLVDEKGTIHNKVTKGYPIAYPHPGWSEQNPEDWFQALEEGIPELLDGFDASEVKGIGCGGQMHGLVILDKEDRVIRPAILWNDGRTAEETAYLNTAIGKDKLSSYTANIAFAGFTAPKLLWLQRQEPESFAKIAKIMLPKDYLNYRMTGQHVCDYSDASGMLLLDIENRAWSREMLEICHIREDQMPSLHESYEVIGTLQSSAAKKLGLQPGVIVVAGAGDNAAAAIGTGTTRNGDCNISIGTSGTVFIASDAFTVDASNSLHAFAHANGKYHLMGCMLSAAACNLWFCDHILKSSDYNALQSEITDEKLGRNPVFFLPYLMGERSPINDTDARGTFTGLSADSTQSDLVQAVLEGVAFGLRDSLEAARSQGVDVKKSCLCGGGARSAVWQKILTNALGIPLEIPQTEEGPGYGAAMLAMTGCGVYSSVQDCADALVHTSKALEPDPEIRARYEERYAQYRLIYPALKDVFPKLHV